MLPASFRGVQFSVRSIRTSGLARRAQTHEYPKRDEVYTEDLGRPPRIYTFEAFVKWGQAREELVAVCSLPLPGTLVHPLFGSRQVVCTGCDEDISNRSVGIAFYSLTFVEQGSNLFPIERPQTKKLVADAVGAGRETAKASFLERFAAGIAPQWVSTAAAGWVTNLSAQIDRATQRMQGFAALAEFARTRGPLRGAVAALIANPSLLGATISDTIQALAQLGGAGLASIRALETLARFGDSLEDVSVTTQSRAVQKERQAALVRLVRTSTALEASLIASGTTLDSYDAAVALRQRINDLLTPELEDAGDRGDDALLGALEGVRAEVVRDLKQRGAELARVRTLTLDATVPALVLAHRLYSDADRVSDLLARNQVIQNPIFVPAGEPLEVLSI